MSYFKLILLITFLSSCSTNKSVVGLYGKCGNKYLSCNQIELKPDKTFEYFIFMDVGGSNIIKGNWEQVSKDSIKLNTFEQPKNLNTVYKGKVNLNQTNIKVKITDWELPLAGAFIVINDNKEGEAADINGVSVLKTQEIKTITYYYLGQKETIEIDDSKYNEIEITVKDLELGSVPKFLTNKVIVINKKKLFFDNDYFLKKTNLKEKQWN